MNQTSQLIESLTNPGRSLKTVMVFLVVGTFGLTLASDALSALVLTNLGNWLENHWELNPIIFRGLILGIIIFIIILLIWLTNWWEWLTTRPTSVAPPTTPRNPSRTHRLCQQNTTRQDLCCSSRH